MMRQDPERRQMDVGLQFVRKAERLSPRDPLEFGLEEDKVVIVVVHIHICQLRRLKVTLPGGIGPAKLPARPAVRWPSGSPG